VSVTQGTLTPVGHIRSADVVASALAASDAGVPDRENAASHGVALKTIRRWRRLYQRRGLPRGQAHTTVPCPKCTSASLDGPAYAELLGWYLGGYLSRGRRGVWNLHVYNDALYPDVNAHIADLMRSVKPGGRPHTRLLPGCVATTTGWKHWPCLFPQHGPGRKHERTIALEDWQRDLVALHPGDFLRGLFHSDGSRTRNWATQVVGGTVKRYDYPRWEFVNRSDDILGLCCWALDLCQIAWRRPRVNAIAVSRRDAVQTLDVLIGPSPRYGGGRRG